MGVRLRVETLKTEKSGTAVAKYGVLERISGSLDGKNGDEGGREEDKRSGAAWQVTRRWRSSEAGRKAWMG